MNNAIDSRFMKGRSKHQDKKNGTKHDIIYMQKEHTNLKKMINNLCDFVQKNYPELYRAQLDEIPVEVYDAFLKTKEDASQNSINTYKGQIQKIMRCAGATYKTGDFSKYEFIRPPLSTRSEEHKLRDIAIGRDLLEEALKYIQDGSGGQIGNKIASMFGPRVFEIEKIVSKDFDFERMVLVIPKGKHRRYREIPMTPSQANVIKPIIKDMRPNQRVAGVGTSAIHKGLTRALERIDKKYGTSYAQELKDKDTNTHAIRKLVATEQYNKNLIREKNNALYRYMLSDEKLRRLGKEKIKSYIRHHREGLIDKYGINRRELEHKAWEPVSEMLGHGKGRWELKETYVISDSTKIVGNNFKDVVKDYELNSSF